MNYEKLFRYDGKKSLSLKDWKTKFVSDFESKEKAITEFSNPSGQFSTKGRYVIAYDMDGTLLANMKVPGEVGSKFIKDDYDAGQVRMMRDMATTGGGLYTDPATGAFWFIMDVDGSWWICAAQYQISGQ